MAKRSRPEFSPRKRAVELLSGLSPEVLRDKQKVTTFARQKGIKMSATNLGRARMEALRSLTGGSEDPFTTGLESKMDKVLKTAKALGGLGEMERVISIIKKAREV